MKPRMMADPADRSRSIEIGGDFKFSAVALAILAVLYWVTRTPVVLPGDSAELITASVSLGLAHPTGYPLYVVLGKLMSLVFFIAPPATVLNLWSAACCLAAFALLVAIALRLRVSGMIVAAVILLLGLTPSIWNYATFAEVYPLHGLILAGILWLVVNFPDRGTTPRLCGIWALAGVSLGNHMTSVLLIPGLAIWTVMVVRSPNFKKPRMSALWAIPSYAVGATIVGLLFWLDRPDAINYINQYSLEVSDPRFSGSVSRILWVVLGQQYQAVSGIAGSLLSFSWLSGAFQVLRTAWIENPVLLVLGTAGLLRGPAWWRDRSAPRAFFVFAGVTSLVNVLYFATYTRFFEPIYLTHLYILLALGTASFLDGVILSGRRRALAACLLTALAVGQMVSHFGTIDKRGTEIYVQETERLLAGIERDAVVFSTWENSSLIWYLQWVERRHREVVVVNAMPHNWPRLAGRFPGRPLYFETIPPGLSGDSFTPVLHFFKFAGYQR